MKKTETTSYNLESTRYGFGFIYGLSICYTADRIILKRKIFILKSIQILFLKFSWYNLYTKTKNEKIPNK